MENVIIIKKKFKLDLNDDKENNFNNDSHQYQMRLSFWYKSLSLIIKLNLSLHN